MGGGIAHLVVHVLVHFLAPSVTHVLLRVLVRVLAHFLARSSLTHALAQRCTGTFLDSTLNFRWIILRLGRSSTARHTA
jgi:hypothetical protein